MTEVVHIGQDLPARLSLVAALALLLTRDRRRALAAAEGRLDGCSARRVPRMKAVEAVENGGSRTPDIPPLSLQQRVEAAADPAEWGGPTDYWLAIMLGSDVAVRTGCTTLSRAAAAGHVATFIDDTPVPLTRWVTHECGFTADGEGALVRRPPMVAKDRYSSFAADRSRAGEPLAGVLTFSRDDVLRLRADASEAAVPPAHSAQTPPTVGCDALSGTDQRADAAVEDITLHKRRAKPRGRPRRYILVAIAEGPLRERLEDEGCPGPGDGKQAELEEWFLRTAEARGSSCSESTARDYVRREIDRRIRQIQVVE